LPAPAGRWKGSFSAQEPLERRRQEVRRSSDVIPRPGYHTQWAGDLAHETEPLRRHRSGFSENRSWNEASLFAGQRGRGVPFGAVRRLPSTPGAVGVERLQKGGLGGQQAPGQFCTECPGARPVSLFELEVCLVRAAVVELDDQLAAGAFPAGIGLPDVGVLVGGRIVGKAARTRCGRVLAAVVR